MRLQRPFAPQYVYASVRFPAEHSQSREAGFVFATTTPVDGKTTESIVAGVTGCFREVVGIVLPRQHRRVLQVRFSNKFSSLVEALAEYLIVEHSLGCVTNTAHLTEQLSPFL